MRSLAHLRASKHCKILPSQNEGKNNYLANKINIKHKGNRHSNLKSNVSHNLKGVIGADLEPTGTCSFGLFNFGERQGCMVCALACRSIIP